MASLQMAAVGAAEEAEEGVDLSPLTMAAGRPALAAGRDSRSNLNGAETRHPRDLVA